MNPSEIARVIAAGQEARAIEFKSAGAWSDQNLRAQLTRSAIAMANTRDGGLIIIGMKEDAGRPGYHVPDQLTSTQSESFDPDVLIPQLNAFADPHLDITVIHPPAAEVFAWVAIAVSDFRDSPILVARDIIGGGNRVLASKGALLVRSRRTSETTQVQDSHDFREIIDLAVDKGLQSYFRRRRYEDEGVPEDAVDDTRFAEQLGAIRA